MLKLSQNKQSHYRTAYAKIKSIAYIDIDVLTISDLQAVIDEQTPRDEAQQQKQQTGPEGVGHIQ